MKQALTTAPTFTQGGVLVPKGTIINVDPERSRDPKKFVKNTPNLADPSEARRMTATPIAAIAPTGPNPTVPQQIPPGTIQVPGGYQNAEGSALVPEGGAAAEEIEEEGVQRTNALDHDGDGKSGGMASAPTEDASAEEINAALAKLDGTNDEHWTQSGKPAVAAVQVEGKTVTRELIEAAAPDAKRPEQAS